METAVQRERIGAKPARNRWRTAVIVIGVLLLIPLTTVLPWGLYEIHHANRALHHFIDLAAAKDYEHAYSESAVELRDFSSYEAFVSNFDNLNRRLGDLKDVDIDSTEVKSHRDGMYATADTWLTFARGSAQFTFVLKKEQGVWKVYSLNEQ